jgi:type I restriction enzyme M protein
VQFKAANVKSKQEFYDSEMTLHIRVTAPKSLKVHSFDLKLGPQDSFTDLYKAEVQARFGKEMGKLTAATLDALETEVSYTHRHYIKDDEYIPFEAGGDPQTYIPAFLEREIEKPIIRWRDRPQLGYEILPNKYFYRYTPPPAADDLLKKFWDLEEKAEGLLKGLSDSRVNA